MSRVKITVALLVLLGGVGVCLAEAVGAAVNEQAEGNQHSVGTSEKAEGPNTQEPLLMETEGQQSENVDSGAGEFLDACSSETRAQEKSQQDFQDTLNRYNEENPPSEDQPGACLGGDIRWDVTKWKMDIPEVTMRRHEWSMHVPESKLRQQEWWIKEPYVKCENKKVGQYPETTCKDTWIKVGGFKTKGVPKCTVKWSDIITKVCWPEMRDKKVVLGVPEVSMKLKKMSMDLPEITMKTREFSMHLPHFYTEYGCVGSGCEEECERAVNEQVADLARDREAATADAKASLLNSTRDLFSCQAQTLSHHRDAALEEFDKNIAVSQASLAEMRVQGMNKPAAELQARLDQMIADRKKMAEELESAIKNIHDQERDVISTLGSG